MNDQRAALLEKAFRALDTAQAVLKLGDNEAAVNRAYYAAFHAASAALLSASVAPRTHNGVLRQFHKHFVATGRLNPSLSETLRYAFSMRQRADYDAFSVFDKNATSDLIADVGRFVQAVADMLEK